jgi:hypothetical protein
VNVPAQQALVIFYLSVLAYAVFAIGDRGLLLGLALGGAAYFASYVMAVLTFAKVSADFEHLQADMRRLLDENERLRAQLALVQQKGA